MNREERRRLRKRRACGIAGVSLAAATGLFGSYLGNPRLPRAYATACAPGAGSGTFDVADQAQFKSAVADMNARFVDNSCFTLNFTSNFTVTEDLFITSKIEPVVQLPSIDDATVSVIGNGHTVTGDPAVARATLFNFDFFDNRRHTNPTIRISDLTISGMHTDQVRSGVAVGLTGPAAADGSGTVTLDNVTVRDTSVTTGDSFGSPAVYFYANRINVNNSSFIDNSITRTGSGVGSSGASAVLTYAVGDGLATVITDTTFSGNTVTAEGLVKAGALYIFDKTTAYANTSPTTIIRSTFTGNTVTSSGATSTARAYGAAIGAYNAELVVSQSVFMSNVATGASRARGGAIKTGGGSAVSPGITVTSSEFSGNRATATASRADGGALFATTSATGVTINSSTFSGNSATSTADNSSGGAVRLDQAAGGQSFAVVNSTFTGNEVTAAGNKTAAGGALWAGGAPLTVDYSTITANQSTGGDADGGGLFSYTPTLRNSIINGNTAARYGADAAGLFALYVQNSLFTSNSALHVIAGAPTVTDALYTADAQVEALTDNGGTLIGAPGSIQVIRTMALKSGAVAIDAGSAAVGSQPQFDERGPDLVRTIGTAPDLGAVEFGLPGPPTSLQATPGAGEASVAFTASVPGSGPVTNYEYQLDGGAWVPLSPVSTGSPVTIPGLVAGQTYSIRLRAVSALGTGAPSLPVTVTPESMPPPPPPVFPPSAPRDVTGVAGDGSVAVSWLPPADAGSFPVTDYRVTAGPGGASCLAKAPALTCTVTGLTNGTAYTFVVTALNGAGWGASSAASDAVTPSPACTPALTLAKGTRQPDGRHDRIRTGGTSACLVEGTRLTPWIRYGDTGAFKEGVASIVVGPQGAYRWTREIRKDKKFVAYVAYEDLDSNRVIWARVR